MLKKYEDEVEAMGFNPCCIGLAIAAFSVYWPVVLILSFNPCCIGLAIAAARGANRLDQGSDVSILVVLD